MNTFCEDPLFLFIDNLADGSSNFATGGKIVELFDTGTDARTPGAALKKTENILQSDGLVPNNIPNVRKPFSLPLRQDKSPFASNSISPRHVGKRQIIAGTSKSPKPSKLSTWNPRARFRVPLISNELEVKTGLDSVVVTQRDGKDSEDSKLVAVSLEHKRESPSLARARVSSTYSEKHRTMKSQSISSSLPKPHKMMEARSTVSKMIGGRAKTSLSQTPENTAKSSQMKTSKVTSEASLNHGIKKYVNRAVDKDSLSNCSRQKISQTCDQCLPKHAYASRLPRSAGAAKYLPKRKLKSETPVPVESGKKATSKKPPMKIVGGTDHELQDKDLREKTTTTIPAAVPGNQRDRPEGETMSKVTSDASSIPISQKKRRDNAEGTLSTKTSEFVNQDTVTLSSRRSKTTVSKMPVPMFRKDSLAGVKTIKKSANLVKVGRIYRVHDDEKLESFDKLSTKMEKPDTSWCRDLDEKLSASDRPVTYTEKVTARPSAKCHNLVSRESELKNTDIGIRRRLSKPRSPSIVPRLMNAFLLQEEKHNEVPKCPPNNLQAVHSVPSKVKTEGNDKLEIKSNGEQLPPRTPGILSEQLNERLSRLSDRRQDVSSPAVTWLSAVSERKGIDHCRVDRVDQNEPKVQVESACLSGVKTLTENDSEIELKTIFADTSAGAVRASTVKSSAGLFGASQIKNSKLRQPPSYPSGAGSRMPRLEVTRRIPKKEITQDFSSGRYPKKLGTSTLRGALKNSVKTDVKTEAEPLTPPTKKSVEHLPESEPLPKTQVVIDPGEDNDEGATPITDPLRYNIHSFASHYRKEGNLVETVSRETADRGKFESWIDGHEQAYLKGRAIGLKVASMARAAKENLRREYVRSGLKNVRPMSLPDKSQEIVDIGLSVVEKVLAEKENEISHAPSVRGDQISDHSHYHKNIPCNGGQWFA